MKWAMRCAAAVMMLVLLPAPALQAQALKLVPSDALVVFRISNMDAVSKKIADFCGTAGLTQMNPDLADPLGMWCKQMGIGPGLNRSGDMVMALMDPAAVGGNYNDALLVLIPVSDYQAFIGNFPGSTTDGEITTFHFKNAPKPAYVAHWGDYAVASPYHDLVVKPPAAALVVGPLAQKEFDSKDMVVFANVVALHGMALPQIDCASTSPSRSISRRQAVEKSERWICPKWRRSPRSSSIRF